MASRLRLFWLLAAAILVPGPSVCAPDDSVHPFSPGASFVGGFTLATHCEPMLSLSKHEECVAASFDKLRMRGGGLRMRGDLGLCRSQTMLLPFSQMRYIMGTLFEITVFCSDESSAEEAINPAFSEVDRLDRLMSNYREDSELSRMNREAAKAPVRIDSELFSVISASLNYSRLTDGAFDITVGPLMRAWGFFRSEGRLPDEKEISRAVAGVGYSKVDLDISNCKVAFASPEVEIDLGGIGKGYALDRAAEALKIGGVSKAVINAGGNLYVLGSVPEDHALVGVKHPRKDGLLAAMRLKDMAVATSGDYEKFFVVGGKRYSHIMDPRTGRPVTGTISATVVSKRATEADALSTAVFVLGPKKGLELVERLPGVECLIVCESPDGRITTVESSGLDNLRWRKK